jgi:hypothetical protein
MSHNGARLAMLGMALLLITGCGGGSSVSGSGSTGGGSGGGTGGGSGGGSGDQATTITVSIVTGIPSPVAVKIGSGNYTAATLTSGQLTISVPAGTTTYSVAYLCPPLQEGSGTFQLETIQFESVQDGTAITGGCASTPTAPPSGNLNGTVDASAFPTAGSMNMVISNATYAQTVQGVGVVDPFHVVGPIGSDRVVIGLYDSFLNNLLAIKNFTNQVVPGSLNGGSTVAFSSNDAPTMQPLTFDNVPTGFDAPYTNLLANLGSGLLTVATGPITQYPQLPAGILQNGDYYSFQSSASVTSNTQQSIVGSLLYPTSGGPVTLSFPKPWSTTGPAAASQPTFSFDYTGYTGESGVLFDAGYSWFPTVDLQNYVSVTATQNYLGNNASLAVPDLSGVSGFLTSPASGTGVSWIEGTFQGTALQNGHPTHQ